MGLLAWGRERLGLGDRGGHQALGGLRLTALDTELTGLDERADDIISLGAVHLQGGRIEIGGAFQAMVRPQSVLDGRTVVIHRITPGELEAMPAIGEVLGAFQDYARGTVLLGHCLSLDLAFLNRDARRAGLQPFQQEAVDTLALYGWLRRRGLEHPALSLDFASPSLFDLARAFEVPVGSAHSALGDAFVTAQLFQRFLPLLQQAGVQDLAGLRRVGDPRQPQTNLQAADGQAHF